ncbi:hypothetical protein [Saccharopolyspora sp. NPDC050642]|uniref:hypothetical protein n=1 Tax=Saccharopolyspora sp. NPDC050642 TaxID=3157099 RepID=UPI0033F277B1
MVDTAGYPLPRPDTALSASGNISSRKARTAALLRRVCPCREPGSPDHGVLAVLLLAGEGSG